MNPRHQAFAILFCVYWLIATSPAYSKEKNSYWISVPVFYATTRQFDGKAFSGARNQDNQDQNVQYGIITVTIPVEETVKDQKVSKVKLGWKDSTKKNEKVSNIEKLSRDDFCKALQGRHQSTEYKESCIFIHGYNNKFDAAARSAARLEIALQEPVILFSWPSGGKTKNYTVDECNAEWSVRPFQVFMQGMEENFGSDQLMTVSHSMGNRLVNWYLQSRYDKANSKPKHFREVVLTSPDIDRATFKNYFFKVADNGDKTRIYVSKKDLPLRLSKFVHGSTRVGSDLMKSENKWEMPGNIKDTETINFSEVDSGLIGHSIQYKVIGNMHRKNEPGEGLKLKEDDSFKGSYSYVQRAE